AALVGPADALPRVAVTTIAAPTGFPSGQGIRGRKCGPAGLRYSRRGCGDSAVVAGAMGDGVSFTLDGTVVGAEAGETTGQVARRLGTPIPHLCRRPEPGDRPDRTLPVRTRLEAPWSAALPS